MAPRLARGAHTTHLEKSVGNIYIWCATCTVLGPLSFIGFINDIDTGINSKIYKFKDDPQTLTKPSAKRGKINFNVEKWRVMYTLEPTIENPTT